MTTVNEIETAVIQLPAQELARFRAWFAQFDAAQWDLQLESDVRQGKLERLADGALQDLADGRCRAL
jgi:hypothetical protein